MILACIDGGLICGPLALCLGLGSLIAWLKCRKGNCHDHQH